MVQIQMQILHFPVLTKYIEKIILLCFFMDSSDQYSPTLNRCSVINPKIIKKLR